MDTRRIATCAIIVSLLAFAGCATSPDEERRRMEMEADIDDILSQELDPAEFGEVRNCLRDTEVRRYRALGDRHLLFEGRQGRLWVNALRGRCLGLDRNSIFVVKPHHGGRLCDMDRFSAVDRLSTTSGTDASLMCALGEFRPVTAAQVEEVENRLEMR